jgi:hypothetical protein
VAKKKAVVTTCDWPASTRSKHAGDAKPVEFTAANGELQVIDLCDAHGRKVRQLHLTLEQHSRSATEQINLPASGPSANGQASSDQRPRSRQETEEIRAWARREHIKVADRGRLPGDVIARYEAAH